MTMLRVLLAAVLLVSVVVPASAATRLEILTLPDGFRVPAEGPARLASIGPDGSVYAIATGKSDRLVRWSRDRTRSLYEAIPDANDHFGAPFLPRAIAVAPLTKGVVVSIEREHDGAFDGMWDDSELWTDGTMGKAFDACGTSRIRTYAADGMRAAVTADTTNDSPYDFLVPDERDAHLPRGYVVDGSACRGIGVGFLTAIRGANVAGFVGFRDGHEWPVYSGLGESPPHALRWIGRTRRDLGPGVAFAIARDGTVAGATARPALTERSAPAPHAVVWDRAGRRTMLFRGDAESVAWAVNEADTVVGAMRDRAGKHFAFRRFHGRVERLDDLPHPAGMRFEAAYDITNDGTILATGTRDGRAVVFVATFG